MKSIIYEDSDMIMAMDTHPITSGHIIIRSRISYSSITEVPNEILGKMMRLAQLYISWIKKNYKPSGYSMMLNQGSFSREKRFSIHLIPRFNQGEFAWTYTEEHNKKAFEFDRIKRYLSMRLSKSLSHNT